MQAHGVNRPLVILASARKQSDTRAFLSAVFANVDHTLIDLLDFPLFPYDYLNNYPDTDTFGKITNEFLRHNVIVFATPVYWYAMSGIMKTLFDRFTDLIKTKKEAGQQLKGKTIFLLIVGADPEPPQGFEVPFQRSADYLHMNYQGCIYHSTKFPKTGKDFNETVNFFTARIKNACR